MKKKVIIAIVVVAVIITMIVINVLKSGNESSNAFSRGSGRAYDVDAVKMEKSSITSTIIVNGQVNEINKSDVILPTQVKIDKLLVSNGDIVKKGDKLLEVDLSSLEDELRQLKLSKEEQILQLNKLKAMAGSTDTTGFQVAIDIAKINLENAKTAYQNAQSTYGKNKSLFDEGIISQSELDTSSKQLEDAKNQVTVSELNLSKSEADLESSKENAEKNNYSTQLDIDIQNKHIEETEMNIDNLNKEISELNTVVISSIDGVVTDINVTEGTLASSMQPIMTIVDNKSLKIVANVKEYDIKKLDIEQKVSITGDAIKEDANVTGTVSYISPIAEESTSSGKIETSISVEITVTDGEEYLKPGYNTECEITTQSRDKAIVVSYDMLKDDDGSKYVFVINQEDNTIRKQPVTLGIVSDFNAEVTDGLQEGDLVISNPSLLLTEGDKVRTTENNTTEDVKE